VKPRTECKYYFRPSEMPRLFRWISDCGGRTLYPDRKISSIYFENASFQMFQETAEGILPRKKIRMRHYNADPYDFMGSQFEVKVSSPYGRLKEVVCCTEPVRILREGIYDPFYGLCVPKLLITYERSYFSMFGYRLTVDRNISYSGYLSGGGCLDSCNAVEVKAPSEATSDYLQTLFPFPMTQFSKYERGCERVFRA